MKKTRSKKSRDTVPLNERTLPKQSLEKLKLKGFSTLCMGFAVRVKNYAKMEGC
jgi:hypothetical protein